MINADIKVNFEDLRLQEMRKPGNKHYRKKKEIKDIVLNSTSLKQPNKRN